MFPYKIANFKNLILFCTLLVLFSCSKKGNEPEAIKGVVGPKLIKAVYLDMVNGFQTTDHLTYDKFGRIKSENLVYANFVAEYNSSGQIALVTQTNTDGSKVIHNVYYNAAGQIFKKIITEATRVVTIIYEYNAVGQLVRFNDPENATHEITWNGDNISEIKVMTAGKVFSSTKYISYDHNLSPYYNIKDFLQITRLSVVSKNNVLKLNNTVAGSSEFLYEYNSNGSVDLSFIPSAGVRYSYYYSP